MWWIQYWDTEGKRKRRKVGRRGDAINLRHTIKADIFAGKILPTKRKRVTFGELADDALEYSKNNKRSSDDDNTRMKRLLEEFKTRPADGIKPQEFERWLTSHESWKPATINRYRALISLTYRLGIESEKVTVNPARLVKHRRENNARTRFLKAEEEVKLREAIAELSPHHLPDFEIALNTGMRLSEQYGLRWQDVNFDQKVLTIPRSKHGEVRHVRMNSFVVAALRTLNQAGNEQPYVFLNRFGRKASGPREWFGAAVSKAGLKGFTWHMLRHTFASRLVMANKNIIDVQQAMGHKTIQMTMRYSHLADDHTLATVEALCDTNPVLEEQTATGTATRQTASIQ